MESDQASVQRLAVLFYLAREEPAGAWRLIRLLIPEHGRIGDGWVDITPDYERSEEGMYLAWRGRASQRRRRMVVHGGIRTILLNQPDSERTLLLLSLSLIQTV